MNGHSSFQTVPFHLLIAGTCLWICNGMEAKAQNVIDTVKPLHISTDLKKMIRFSGYVPPRRSGLIISDSIKFNGIQTVKQLTINQFMKMTQAEEDKYKKLMEAIYKPLLEEQRRIIESGVGKGTFHYNAKVGYQDPMKMPTELLNENTHTEDKYQSWQAKEAEVMKKYERPQDKGNDKK
ncbi:hypothetical protein [Paludibacter jiangxiensis]|uniref:Uncharacterized protein n=1 Tax=Paludibacter jiangxiensis TaxID=681398 RepID=A0A161LE63_9BACT|nr:hypothetical protein [Paludibacter jiangxiensis]MDP4204159.1 hypothetical protein [Bacteroidota bacterium]GAT62457.1 hypothetical protein PJIAN_216 [Paludibacter jiangxiensis]